MRVSALYASCVLREKYVFLFNNRVDLEEEKKTPFCFLYNFSSGLCWQFTVTRTLVWAVVKRISAAPPRIYPKKISTLSVTRYERNHKARRIVITPILRIIRLSYMERMMNTGKWREVVPVGRVPPEYLTSEGRTIFPPNLFIGRHWIGFFFFFFTIPRSETQYLKVGVYVLNNRISVNSRFIQIIADKPKFYLY